MKKIFIIFAAMLIAVTSSAQIKGVMPTKMAVKNNSQTIMKMLDKPRQTASFQKDGDISFWYSFNRALEIWWGEELDSYDEYLICDTLGKIEYSDGTFAPVFMNSLGQVYDWSHPSWTQFYSMEDYAAEGYSIPDLNTAESYSIDSIGLVFLYNRGTNVPVDVVDTIAITYIANLDSERIFYHIGNYDENGEWENYAAFPAIPYDEHTFMPERLTSTDTLSDAAIIIHDKIPLTIADSTETGYVNFRSFPTPAGLTDISGKVMAVTLTFIPGNERTPESIIGTDISRFTSRMYIEPREEYLDYGSEELCNDFNVSLWTGAFQFDPEDNWYGSYMPTSFIVNMEGNMLRPFPFIQLNITAHNSFCINVEDMEEQNIAVYPNPATDNIRVNLVGDGKAHIQLFNLLGQQMYSENATNTALIDVSNFDTGIYVLKVTQNGKIYTSKLIVK